MTINRRWFHLLWPVVVIAGLLMARQWMGDPTMREGQRLYEAYCMNCHGENGEGFLQMIPPLAAADYLEIHLEELPCVIINGLDEPIRVNGIEYDLPMAGMGEGKLSVSQVQSLIHYVRNAWGNVGKKSSRKEVEEWIEKCD